jgi:ParB family chromosome partitioning protein
VLQRLLTAPVGDKRPAGPLAEWVNPCTQRAAVSVPSSNRQGATVRLHAGSGSNIEDLLKGIRDVLERLAADGKGVQA